MSEVQAPVQTLPAVQYLRGIAAMMVALGHSMIELPKVTAFGNPDYTVHWNYGFGVDLFFVISGFIMIYTASDGFGDRSSQRRFVFARLARIGPLYWLVTTLYLAIALLLPSGLNAVAVDLQTVLGSYLFVPVANPRGVVLPLVAVGWSLNYEMLFYALFTLAMFLPRKPGQWLVVAVLVLLPILGWLADPESPTLRFWTDNMVIEFAFGAMLGMFAGRLNSLPRFVAPLLGLAGLAGFALPNLLDGPGYLGPRFLISGVPAALIVASAIGFDLQNRTIDVPILRTIGNASYSLYLTHPFVIRAARIGWNSLLSTGPAWLFCPSALVAAILVGLAVATTVELPLHRWTKARSRRRFVAPATVA